MSFHYFSFHVSSQLKVIHLDEFKSYVFFHIVFIRSIGEIRGWVCDLYRSH